MGDEVMSLLQAEGTSVSLSDPQKNAPTVGS